MLKTTRKAMETHAEESYPKESCGLMVMTQGEEVYWPCKNLAEGNDSFVMDQEDWAKAEDAGEILAVIHSHPDYVSDPSEADKLGCEATQLPWIILSVREGKAEESTVVSPSGYVAPLVGRQFFHGFLDCYTLIKDWYSREAGIELLDFKREDDWWNKGQDIYAENFAKTGFRELTADEVIQPGDVVLMSIRSPVANHGGVYIDSLPISENPKLHAVPNAMLHHLYGRLSERVVYGGYWASMTNKVLRHKDFK